MEGFEDLVLKFESEAVAGKLLVQLIEPFAGGSNDASALLSVPAELLKLPAVSDSGESLRKLGSDLFDALFQGRTRDAWLERTANLSGGRGRRCRLLFDLEEAVQRRAFALPWEILHRPDTRDFLALDERTSIVRSLASRRPALQLAPLTRLRVVGVFACPEGLTELGLAAERQQLEALAAELPQLELQIVPEPTLESLTRTLDAFDAPTVVVFSGHGVYTGEQGGFLCFEDGHRGVDLVPASVFAECSKSASRPWLVILNACETAAVAGDDPSASQSSLAAALAMAGVPAVVAMRTQIGDSSASRFSRGFFAALAAGEPVEVAVTRARRVMFSADRASADWSVPLLITAQEGHRLRVMPTPSHADEGAAPSSPPEVPRASSSTVFHMVGDKNVGQVLGDLNQDLRQTHTTIYSGDVLDPETSKRLEVRFWGLVGELPEAIRADVAIGLDCLEGKRYGEARDAFRRARRRVGDHPRITLYESLATIGGRRLRDLSPAVAERLAESLRTARERWPDFPSLLFLFAALSEEYFVGRGFRPKPPGAAALLGEFNASRCALADLELLRTSLVLTSAATQRALKLARERENPAHPINPSRKEGG